MDKENDDEENDLDPDSPSDGYPKDGEEGWGGGKETEFNVCIEMVAAFPRQHTPDTETGMRDVSAAFEEADVGSWAYGADARMDDDMLWIELTTSVMADDSMAAEDFCEETLGQAILKKKGYCAEDVSCTAEES